MGTHPIFESDFDCLTESNDMILRRRGGSLRVVVGTSIFWILVFFSSSDWWCKTKHLHLKNAEDLKPAKEQWSDVINDGLQKGFDAVAGVVSKNGPGEMGAAVKIP